MLKQKLILIKQNLILLQQHFVFVIAEIYFVTAEFNFLLKQNFEIENLTFSIKDNDIVLSLMIYDRYLNEITGRTLFKYLFEQADAYDNILVEQYGAEWR